ncbi:MAG: hypothetical protein QHH19_06725 [Candidatus Thermoplasmatota archaeon]|jgi:hypothetical protein|nr:hypothetical protein [Candidatus Thermoplasmatota archaeon]
MKKILIQLFFIAFILNLLFSNTVDAGQAGVGVLNVPPKYGYIRVEQQNDLMRVYLTISDYNSWGDIYEVSVTLYNYEKEVSKFIFRQYKNLESYVEINEFSEIPERNNLLVKEKCLYNKSNKKETIDERCDIEIRFVFKKTWFTGIHVLIQDRQGSNPAEAYIYYNTEEAMRSGNNIVIPGFGGIITLVVPPYMLDIIAITIGLAGAIYYLKKKRVLEKRGVVYGEI